MSDDPHARQAQSKFDQPAIAGPGLTRPIEAATSEQDAVPMEAPGVVEHPAQVKATAPFVSPPAAVPAVPPAPVPPAPVPAVHTAPVAAAPALGDNTNYDDAAEDSADDKADIPVTLAARLRRLSPALVILSILSIGSLVFLALAMTSHTTPVPVLLSAAVVTGLAFAVDAVVTSFMTWRAGQNGQGGKALVLALVGGTSAVIAAGAFAGTLILALLLKG